MNRMPRDPVCGMQLRVDEAVASVRHDQVTYYLCSEECRQRFEKQPAVYTE
ncbi:YHS domain-containing protein [Haloferax sp. Atlit-10N]|uniref:YHS domain-containing protein n=3 Tax=Halobacteriales TaxID=2235 RepID=A0A8J8PAB1_9EURY|nr:YHS domain-containing protein [Haloferax sp. Atlit-10N]TQQ78420.1 YHS domain-containing protein [Halonotius terrestris]